MRTGQVKHDKQRCTGVHPRSARGRSIISVNKRAPALIRTKAFAASGSRYRRLLLCPVSIESGQNRAAGMRTLAGDRHPVTTSSSDGSITTGAVVKATGQIKRCNDSRCFKNNKNDDGHVTIRLVDEHVIRLNY